MAHDTITSMVITMITSNGEPEQSAGIIAKTNFNEKGN